ncbi:MAG TPA: DUF3618 domain-containing protein [Polyangiaceae bacterium]|nr:DUF3618 domain-containing protein [Polyangiaceae bacterium]
MTQHGTDLTESRVDALESDIDQTRNTITEDIKAIGEKLSPENLKTEAREVLNDAKDAAVGKLRDVKDAAVDSVTETLGDVRDRAVEAGDATWSFARQNAIPLALIGLGISWLVASNRRTNGNRWRSPGYGVRGRGGQSRRYYDDYAYGYDDDGYESGAEEGGRAGLRETASGMGHSVREGLSHATERVGEVASRAGTRVHDIADRAGTRVHDMAERAEHAISDGTSRAREFAGRELQHLRSSSRQLANQNPLALGAVALVAGVGVGMLLPRTDREDELLGASRDRLVEEARGAAQELGRAAQETAREVKSGVSGLVSS